MTQLTPYNRNRHPHSLFDAESFFDRFFNDAFLPSLYLNTSQMRVDVKENEREYIVEADLPGIKKEEIGIDLHDNLLTISVARNETVDEENERYIRKERKYGYMSRSFTVANVNEEAIKAQFDNGVLKVILPKLKQENTKIKRIEIH
jgi:HSP20 family protein